MLARFGGLGSQRRHEHVELEIEALLHAPDDDFVIRPAMGWAYARGGGRKRADGFGSLFGPSERIDGDPKSQVDLTFRVRRVM